MMAGERKYVGQPGCGRGVRRGIMICLLSLFVSTSVFAMDGFKTPPDPVYSEEAGYGWDPNVPVDKPENVWNILKVWATTTTKSVFLDKDKDGSCDTVLNFFLSGVNREGQEMFTQVPTSECAATEAAIKKFLKSKGI